MQTINQRIQNPLFVGMFMLLPVFAAVAGVLLMTMDQKAAGILFLAAAAVYVLGALFPSFAVNIPMNNDLDGVTIPKHAADAARIWQDYSGRWTAWNTVRAVFSWISLLAMGAGAYLWGKTS
ncbi:anthrone oxygenase family protein [Actinomadura physcomitrii]